MNYSSRRNFLAGLGGAGAAAIMATRGLRGQTAPNARAIDCHHHFVSPGWIKALTAKENHKVAGYTTWFALPQLRTYTPAKDLKDMDRDGVAVPALLHHAWRVVWGSGRNPQPGARDERFRRSHSFRSQKSLRPVRYLAAADYRRQPSRNRIRLRYAQGRRRRDSVELRQSLVRRSNFQAGPRRVEPAQCRGLRASHRCAVLPGTHAGRGAGHCRVQHRYRAHDFQPTRHQRGDTLQQYPFRFFPRRRHHALAGPTLRHRPAR